MRACDHAGISNVVLSDYDGGLLLDLSTQQQQSSDSASASVLWFTFVHGWSTVRAPCNSRGQ